MLDNVWRGLFSLHASVLQQQGGNNFGVPHEGGSNAVRTETIVEARYVNHRLVKRGRRILETYRMNWTTIFGLKKGRTRGFGTRSFWSGIIFDFLLVYHVVDCVFQNFLFILGQMEYYILQKQQIKYSKTEYAVSYKVGRVWQACLGAFLRCVLCEKWSLFMLNMSTKIHLKVKFLKCSGRLFACLRHPSCFLEWRGDEHQSTIRIRDTEWVEQTIVDNRTPWGSGGCLIRCLLAETQSCRVGNRFCETSKCPFPCVLLHFYLCCSNMLL